ncbi:MAG: ABC transporter substrate-binding protein, partial [Candidatus Wallbacteria bacterium]|nr:ABC transporter substrate-binding protein [Candidatus Wallbacteria bacterium]
TQTEFKDLGVRQALAMAIDREQLVREVDHGFGSVHAGPFSKTSWAYDATVKPLPYDPAGAKRLLLEAGWPETREIVFSYAVSVTNLLTAALVKKCWEEIGLKVKNESLPLTDLLYKMQKRDFDAGLMYWDGLQDPDDYSLIWESKNIPESDVRGSNFSSYQNSEVDRLFEEGRVTIDLSKRQKIYRRIHRLICEDQPVTFLESYEDIWVVHKRFHNIEPGRWVFTNVEKWYVPSGMQRYLK